MTRPVVALLHAFPLDSRMWDEVRGPLEAAGWEVRAPELGDGESMAAWAERILADIDGPLVPVGSSMGGYLAFELWRQAPERIAGLGLVGTRPGADSPEAREAREATLRLVADGGVEALWEQVGPKLTAEPSARAREIALSQDPARVATAVAVIRDREDSTALLPEIGVPVLIVAGAEDALIPPAESEAMALALPDARLVLLPGSGHLPPLERSAELVDELLRFLGELA
jgi:pimeloyl-ACP methyl ester carboxylesterase